MDDNWQQGNRRYLMRRIALVRHYLERHVARTSPKSWDDANIERAKQEARELEQSMPARPALIHLRDTFSLSTFETDLVALCAGMELDEELASYCAAVHGGADMDFPTLRLAAVLPGADWGALSTQAALRHWRLLEVATTATLTTARLRLDESILFFLTGVLAIDRHLAGLVQPLNEASALAPSQRRAAERVARVWEQHRRHARRTGRPTDRRQSRGSTCDRRRGEPELWGVDSALSTPKRCQVVQRSYMTCLRASIATRCCTATSCCWSSIRSARKIGTTDSLSTIAWRVRRVLFFCLRRYGVQYTCAHRFVSN